MDTSTEPTPRPDLADWMTAQEVADWLGVSTRVLASNRVPHAKVGERRFYNKHDVAGWLERRRDSK
jgi:excisionase family DNA binding protein